MNELPKIPECPNCGGTEGVEAESIFEGSLYLRNKFGDLKPHGVHHQVCTACGTVLASVVQRKKLCSCGLCQEG